LPGFRRHLADHFPDKQRELRLLRRDVFASTQQFSESASMVKGIDFATRLGARSCWPVRRSR
jgi:hypothetical protein